MNWRNMRSLRKSSLSITIAACCIASLNMAALTRWPGGCRLCSDSAAVLGARERHFVVVTKWWLWLSAVMTNEETLQSFLYATSVIEWRSVTLGFRVERTGQNRNAYRILVWKLKDKKSFKTRVMEMWREGVNWISRLARVTNVGLLWTLSWTALFLQTGGCFGFLSRTAQQKDTLSGDCCHCKAPLVCSQWQQI